MAVLLDELFRREGTDKLTHGYAELYEALLYQRRFQVSAVLEVGIGTLLAGAPSSMRGFCLPGYSQGGSLRAWRDFFPNAHIYGIDIQADSQLELQDRVTTALCNSTNVDDVRLLLGRCGGTRFDLIIDDGSHSPGDQIATFRNLFPALQSGGYYVIEDIQPHAFRSRADELRVSASNNPLFFLSDMPAAVCCKLSGQRVGSDHTSRLGRCH